MLLSCLDPCPPFSVCLVCPSLHAPRNSAFCGTRRPGYLYLTDRRRIRDLPRDPEERDCPWDPAPGLECLSSRWFFPAPYGDDDGNDEGDDAALPTLQTEQRGTLLLVPSRARFQRLRSAVARLPRQHVLCCAVAGALSGAVDLADYHVLLVSRLV